MSNKKLRSTILKLAHHYRDPADLLHAVRKEHPDASKKEIILVAFETMIEAAEGDEGLAGTLHKLAMDHRGDDD